MSDSDLQTRDSIVTKIIAELRKSYPAANVEFMLLKEMEPMRADEEWADTPLIVTTWESKKGHPQQITINVGPQFIKYWIEDFDQRLSLFKQSYNIGS